MTTTVKGFLVEAAEKKTFSIKWKIDGFFVNCEKVRDSYESPVFTIQYSGKVTKWYMQVFPKGENEDYKNSVSLFLGYDSEIDFEVTVDFKVSIICKRNGRSMKKEATNTFKGPASSWGWDDFVQHDVVKDEKNGALIDDTMTILCQITFHDQAVSGALKVYDDLLDNIGNGLVDYETLLEGNNFSDVTFNMQGKKLYLHRAILMCRNPVFKAMFEHEMKEKIQSLVEIRDVKYAIMKELFRFIYSGKVNNIKKIAKDLLMAADKYSVTELKALCEKTLYENLKVDNAIDYLKLTDTCDTIHLKTLVIEFAAAHYKDVVKQPGFEDLNSQVMHKIFLLVAETGGEKSK